MNWLSRQELLLGKDTAEKLKKIKIAVIGLGGVGGAAAEALCRAGIGNLVLVDKDVFEVSNLNRQILATTDVLGKSKVKTASVRLTSINPQINIAGYECFLSQDNLNILFDENPDFIIDAIDTIHSKVSLIINARAMGIPMISCMGAGNRIDPVKFVIGDISDTAGTGCPVSRRMRYELKKRNILSQTVLYSTEPPIKVSNNSPSPGSISFVPPVAGYMMAGYAIRYFINK